MTNCTIGENGFRVWFQPATAKNAKRLKKCDCGWAPGLGKHYRKKWQQAQDKPRAFNDPDVFETDADVAEFDKLFEQEKAKLEKDAGKKKVRAPKRNRGTNLSVEAG